MGRLRSRLNLASRTRARLVELSGRPSVSDVERDAAIQRFEFSFEAAWKAAQHYLAERKGIDAASPKAAIRSSLQVGLLSEADTRLALEMADDRNLTVHTYNEDLAKRIFADLDRHAGLLERWISAMERRAGWRLRSGALSQAPV